MVKDALSGKLGKYGTFALLLEMFGFAKASSICHREAIPYPTTSTEHSKIPAIQDPFYVDHIDSPLEPMMPSQEQLDNPAPFSSPPSRNKSRTGVIRGVVQDSDSDVSLDDSEAAAADHPTISKYPLHLYALSPSPPIRKRLYKKDTV